MKFKRLFIIAVIILTCCVGVFSGCADKYQNISLELSQETLTLSLSNLEGEENLKTSTISATLKNVPENMLKGLTYSQTNTDVLSITFNATGKNNVFDVVFTAIAGGTSVVTVKHNESGKSANITVNVIEKLNNLYTIQNGGAYAVVGKTTTINTTKNVGFVPSTTTEKEIKYTLTTPVEGVVITEAGEISVATGVSIDNVNVTATSVANPNISTIIPVKVIIPISIDDIQIKSGQTNVSEIVLSSEQGEDNTVELEVQVATIENIKIYTLFSVNNIAEIDAENQIIYNVSGQNIGSTILTFKVAISGYEDYYVEKNIAVYVKQKPNQVLINDKVDLKHTFDIFDWYANGLGSKLNIKVNPVGASDKRVQIIVPESAKDLIEFSIYDNDKKTVLNIDEFLINGVGENIYIQNISNSALINELKNRLIGGENIEGVKLVNGNIVVDVKFYAFGCEEFSTTKIYANCQLTLKKGIKNIIVNDLTNNTIYVKTGEITPLNVTIEPADSLLIDLKANIEQEEIAQIISNENGISLHGLKNGRTRLTIFSESGATTSVIDLVCFTQALNFGIVAPTAEENGNVYQSDYISTTGENAMRTLNSIILAKGTGVQLLCNTLPSSSTVVNVSYSSSNNAIASINSAGYVVGRGVGNCSITVRLSTYVLNNGVLEQINLEKSFAITIINPLKSFAFLSKSVSVYNADGLGYYGLNNKLNTVLIPLSIDAISASCIENGAISTNLRIALSNNFNGEISAELVEDGNSFAIKITSNIVSTTLTKDLYLTLTATLQDYSRYFIQTCQVIIKAPVKVREISFTNVETDNEIYLEGRNGLNEYSSTNNYEEGEYVNTFKIASKILPNNVTNQNVKYIYYGTNDNKNVCYIQKDGTVIPFKAGAAVFRIIPEDAFIEDFDGTNYASSLEKGYVYAEITIIIADGTQSNPYLIKNAEQLQNINNALDKYYVLTNDINLTGYTNFTSIGVGTQNGFTGGLNGKYNGVTYSILGLQVSENNAKYGLFYKNNGTIENLNLEISSINFVILNEQDFMLGGLTTINNGLISNCSINILSTNISGLIGNDSAFYFGAIAYFNSSTGTIKGDYSYFSSVQSKTTVSGNVNITANGNANKVAVGGVVAINNGAIEKVKSELSIIASNISNVGGIVGINNSGTINDAYYSSNALYGNENVGGIVGQITGTANLTDCIVEIFSSNNVAKFKAKNNLGGLVGSATNIDGATEPCISIAYSFVRNYGDGKNVLCVENSTASEINVGGLIGKADYLFLNKSYSNLKLELAIENQTLNFGGLIGKANVCEIANIYSQGEYAFDYENGAIINANGLIGTLTNVLINFSYSTVNFVDNTGNDLMFSGLCLSNAIGNYNYYEKRTNNENGFGTGKSNVNMTTQNTFETWNFTTIWGIASGKNSSYPYLKRENNSPFLTEIPTSISLTLKNNYGMILNESILNVDDTNTITSNGNKLILPFSNDVNYALDSLVELNYQPVDAQRKVRIVSSSPSVIAVDDANKLFVKGVGYAIITIYSSYTESVFCTFEICVSDMFTSLNITNAQGESLKDANTINIKKNGTENIYVSLYNNGTEILSNPKFGIYYSSDNTTDLKISNVELNNLLTYSGTNVLQAQNTMLTNKTINLKATPYFKVNFDGIDYVVYVKNLAIDFAVNVYLGVDEIYLSETENQMSLKNQLSFSLYVKSDLADEQIEIEQQLLVSDAFETVIENSNRDYTELLLTNKTLLENGYVKYDYTLFVKEEFLQYAGEGVNPFNVKQKIKFNFYQNQSESKVATYTLTLLPQKVLKIDLNHYPAGEVQNFGGTTSYYPQELPDNRINPGKQGILKLNVYPNFSNFDYLEITSSLDSKSNRVYFQQVVFDQKTKSYVALHPAYSSTTYGINLKPVSYTDGTFDGSIFVKTLIVSKVDKGTSYDIIVTAYKDKNQQYVSETLKLFAENLPGITLLYNNSTTGYVAQNTTSSAINFEITDYDGAGDLNLIATVKQGDVILPGLATISRIGDSNYCNLAVGNSPIGSKIYVSAQISRTINGLKETSSSTVVLTVVDFLINSIEVEGAQVNQSNLSKGTLKINLGSKSDLKVNVNTTNSQDVEEKISSFEKIISNNLANWYYVRSTNSTTGVNVTENLILNQIYSNFAVGQNKATAANAFYIQAKKVSTNSMIEVVVKYGYSENGEIAYYNNSVYYNLNDQIVSVVDAYEFTFTFNLKIVATSELTNPIPVTSADEFIAMEENLDYILMENISLGSASNPYTAISTKISSFDGNGHFITINNLNTATTGTTGKYGLFAVIDSNTIIKNLTVNYKTSINLPVEKNELYFGGLAAENNGIITNCEVVKGEIENLTIIQSAYNAQTYVGGLVAVNNSYITNSRVGDVNNGALFRFNAPVNVAGLVYSNNGKISSCYVGGNIEITNNSTQTGATTTSGFVGLNAGTVSYSFVEGYAGNFITTTNGLQGGKVESSGNVAGFVYENSGNITDCYSLIMLATHSGRIAGFAYKNNINSKISNSYSACTFEVSESNMNFIGNDELNQIQAKKEDIINCYYYVEETTMANVEEFAYAIASSEFGRQESFSSLFVGEGSVWKMGVYWKQDGRKETNISNENVEIPNATQITGIRPYLITARTKSVSVREQVEGDEAIYPYWYRYTINQLGSENNPIIITNAEEFIFYLSNTAHLINNTNYNHIRLAKDIDLSSISDAELKQLQNVTFAGKLDGNAMMVSNVRVIATDNNTMLTGFGMFKQIGVDFMQELSNGAFVEKFDTNIPDSSRRTIIKNINFEIAEVSATEVTSVGVLAGEIINSQIINLKLTGKNIVVEGKNMVGALAGRVSGDSKILNVSSNLGVRAMHNSTINEINETSVYDELSKREVLNSNNENKFTTSNDQTYSFAGGIVGVADIYKIDFAHKNGDNFDVNRELEDLTVTTSRVEFTSYNLSSLTVEGSVDILGTISGGVIGYLGSGSTLNNGHFKLSLQTASVENQKIIGKYTSGGLVGASKGYVYKSKVAYENSAQQRIDDEIINETGNGYYGVSLFYDAQVSPKYVGGLIGIQLEGIVSDCYSRANVINRNAEYVGGIIGKMFYKYNAGVATKPTIYESAKIISSYTTGNVLAREFKRAEQAGEKDISAGKAGGTVGYVSIGFINEPDREEKVATISMFYGVVSANNWQIKTTDLENTGAMVGAATLNNSPSIISLLGMSIYRTSNPAGNTLKVVANSTLVNSSNCASYARYLKHRTNTSFPTTSSVFGNFDTNVWSLFDYSMPVINSNRLSRTIISNANDLKNIMPNGYYVLVDDIYLDDYWKPLNINFAGTLTSMKTKDSTASNPKYYTIYNLNIKESSNIAVNKTEQTASGLFAQTNGATFMNFNIVVGTNTDKSGIVFDKLTTCDGINVQKAKNKISSVGTLAGRAIGTTVLNVNINFKEFLTNINGENTYAANFVSNCDNMGGIFGYAQDCHLQGMCVVKDMKINCTANDASFSQERKIGGIAGEFSSTNIQNSQEGASKTSIGVQLISSQTDFNFINVENGSATKLYVGAIFGKFSNANLNMSNCQIFTYKNVSINVKNNFTSSLAPTYTYVGGYVGSSDYADFYGNEYTINNININVSTKDANNSSNVIAGGFAGSVKNSIINNFGYTGRITSNENGIAGMLTMGMIAGESINSKVENCRATNYEHVDGNNEQVSSLELTAQSIVGGGFIGLINNSTITKCAVVGKVALESKSASAVNDFGNFAGSVIRSTVEKCFTNVNSQLTFNTRSYIGGFSGTISSSNIINDYSLGEINLIYNEEKEFVIGGFVGNVADSKFGNEKTTYTATMLKIKSIDLINIGTFAGKSTLTTFGENIKYVYEFIGAVAREGEYATKISQKELLESNKATIVFEQEDAFISGLQNMDLGSFYNPYVISATGDVTDIKNIINSGYYLLMTNIIVEQSNTFLTLSDVVLNGNGKNIYVKKDLSITNGIISNIEKHSAILNLGIVYQNNKISSTQPNYGAFANSNNGFVNQCYVLGDADLHINNALNAAGFVSYNEGYIYSSASKAILNLENANTQFISGFVSENTEIGVIFNSFTTAIMGIYKDSAETTSAAGTVYINNGKISTFYSAAVLNVGKTKYEKTFINEGEENNVYFDSDTISKKEIEESKIPNNALRTIYTNDGYVADNYNYAYPLLAQFENNLELFFTGNGLEETPYQVQSLVRLDLTKTKINKDGNVYYLQVCDFDLITQNNYLIEKLSDSITYNGNSFAIYNLIQKEISNGGLFKTIIANSTIKNLGLVDVDINSKGTGNTGAFASTLNGSLENCYAKGNIQYVKASGDVSIGGLVGNAETASIMGCYSQMHIFAIYSGTTASKNNIGGIAGKMKNSTLSTLISAGSIKDYKQLSNVSSNIGGLVGNIALGSSTINNCYVLTSLLTSQNAIANLAYGASVGNLNISNIISIKDYTINENPQLNVQIKSFNDCINTAISSDFTKTETGIAYINSIKDTRCFNLSSGGILNPYVIDDAEKLLKFLSGKYLYARLTNNIDITNLIDSLPETFKNGGLLGSGFVITNTNNSNKVLFNNANNLFVSNLKLNNINLAKELSDGLIINNLTINGSSLVKSGAISADIQNSYIKNVDITNCTMSMDGGGQGGFVANNISNSYVGKINVYKNNITTDSININNKLSGIAAEGYNIVFDTNTVKLGTTENHIAVALDVLAGYLISTTKPVDATSVFVDVYGENTIEIQSKYVVNNNDALIAGLIANLEDGASLNVTGSTTGNINHLDNDSNYASNKYYVGGFVAKNKGIINGGTNNININVQIAANDSNEYGYSYLYNIINYKTYDSNFNFITENIEAKNGQTVVAYVYEENKEQLKNNNNQNYYGYYNHSDNKYYKNYDGTNYSNEIIFAETEIKKQITLYAKIPNVEGLNYGTELPSEDYVWVYSKTPKIENGAFVVSNTGFVMEELKISAPEGEEGWYYTNKEVIYSNSQNGIAALYYGTQSMPDVTNANIENISGEQSSEFLETVTYKEQNIFGAWKNSSTTAKIIAPVLRKTTSYVGGIAGYSFENSKIKGATNSGLVSSANYSTITSRGDYIKSPSDDKYDPESKTGYVGGISDVKNFVGGVAGFVAQEKYPTNAILNGNQNTGTVNAIGGKRYFQYEQYAIYTTYVHNSAFALEKFQENGIIKINSLAYAGGIYGGNLSGEVDKTSLCSASFQVAQIVILTSTYYFPSDINNPGSGTYPVDIISGAEVRWTNINI